jgi:DNA-binding SARP family transcriptional activator
VSRSRGAETATGVTALLTLLALVIGLPVLLYALGGSPLPGHVPDLSRIGHYLLHRDSASVVLGAVRDVSWIAWLLFTIGVLAEVQALARRRTPPRLWLGGLQGAAGRLVALAALTFSSAPVGTLLSTPQPASAAVVADQAPEHATTAARTGSQGMSMGFFQLVTVRPGDCLWTIARHYLGDGDRYTEIVALNMGHDMGHGHVFTDPSMIWPGWVLHLPARAGGHGSGGRAPHTDGSGHPTGGATHPGHPTSHRPFSHPHPSASASGNGHAPSGARSTAPVTASNGDGGAASPGGSASQVRTRAAGLESTPQSQLPLILAFGTGALAGGAAVSLSRLRHRQRQTRRRGRRIPLPVSAPVAEAEQRLNLAAAHQPVESLRGVLRDLGAALVASGQQIPEIEALRLAPDVLDILLASPAIEPPPPPFTVPGGRQGKAWRLALSDPLPGYADDETGDLLPGLLTIGAAEGGYLLLDLEHLQVTQVCGPEDMAAALLRSSAAELATGQLAGWYDLILVGFPELAVLGGRGTCCDDLDAGLDLLAAKAVALRRRLGDDPLADVRYHRLTEPGDEDWALTLLVSAEPPTSAQLDLLSDLAADPGGIAALVPGGAGTSPGHREPVTIDLEATGAAGDPIVARIWPQQLEARPQPLDEADYQALTTLFATASEDYDVSPADPPYDEWTWPADLAGRAEPDPPGPDGAEDGTGPAASFDAADPELPGQAGAADPDPVEVGQEHWPAAPGWAAGGDWATDPGWTTAAAQDPEGDGEAAGADLAGPPAAWLTEPPARNGHHGAAQGEPAAPAPADKDETGGQAAAPPPAAASAEPGDRAPGEPPAQRPALRIGVLGAFTINGQPGALLPAQSQLVLALALNAPSGLSNQQLCYLLGADPDRPKPSDSLRQLIVRTRRQLGRAPDRREWIEHLGGGQYALHPDARFDWREFDALTTEGMRARDAQRLREALSLIRGRPFTGCYYWWLDLATTEAVRAQIVDAADVLAALELAAGNPAAAARAARIGLSGDAAAEQLWRALMRAEHAAGNLTGVREAWNRCLDAIAEIASDGEPHPGTAALYRELLGGAPAGPAWAGERAAG